jgi:hypothetical protein
MSSERPEKSALRCQPLIRDAKLNQVLDELKEYFHGIAADGPESPPATKERPREGVPGCWCSPGERP